MRNRGGRGWRMHFSKRMWLLLALLALLPVLALMQYYWIGQVSEAAQQRAKARLENSVEQLITEFDAEITRAHMTFWQTSGEQASPAARLAQRYQDWIRLAPYPQLIRDVYLIETAGDSSELSHIDGAGRISPITDRPKDLLEIRNRLEETGRLGQPGFRWISALDDLTIDGNSVLLVPMREALPGAESFSRRPPRFDGPRHVGLVWRHARRRHL